MDNNEEDKKYDPIGEALGIPATLDSKVQEIISIAHNDSATTDFESARAELISVIETGQDALFNLAEIAKTSQNPRAYEVVAKLMDSIVAANKERLELQSKIREIQAADAPVGSQAKTINNNLFVGSTAELQKMIENMKSGGSAT